jgi:integrase
MGIIAYKKEVAPGVYKQMYMVVAEAINKYTGKRIQKKKRGILSEPKAQRIHRELWSACRDERPDEINFTYWGQLLSHYTTHVSERVRSDRSPLGFSPRVVASKKSCLKHTEAWSKTHLDLFTPQFVCDRLDELEQNGMSRSMSNHVIKEIKCAFGHGTNCGAIRLNPFSGMKMRRLPKKRKEALTHEEADLLLHEAKRQNHPYYNIWLLTLALGLRRSELAGLKWIDVDFANGLLHVRRQKIPGEGVVDFLKDREERVVAIPSFLSPILKELKLKARTEFVIEVKCSHWNDGGQAEVLRDFCRKIGLKEVTHHQLRATHITLALVDGVPLGIVKENVGHAKLSTTDIYFRSAGINMIGQMDGLKLRVPNSQEGQVIKLKSSR